MPKLNISLSGFKIYIKGAAFNAFSAPDNPEDSAQNQDFRNLCVMQGSYRM